MAAGDDLQFSGLCLLFLGLCGNRATLRSDAVLCHRTKGVLVAVRTVDLRGRVVKKGREWMVKKICGFSAKRSIATRFNRRRTPCLPRQKEKFSIVEIILPNIIAVSPSQVQKKRSSTKQFTTPLPSMEYRIIHACGNNYEICWTRTRRGLDRVDFSSNIFRGVLPWGRRFNQGQQYSIHHADRGEVSWLLSAFRWPTHHMPS